MTSARHRCFSLLMAKDQFTSPMTSHDSHYDTPGTFDKNLLVCHRILIRLSTVNLKVKPVLQIAQHITKQVKKLHTSKVKQTQTKQSERREIVINRNEYSMIIYSTNLHYRTPEATTKAKASSSANEKQ